MEPQPQTWVCTLGGLCFEDLALEQKSRWRKQEHSTEAAVLYVFRCIETEMLNLLVWHTCVCLVQDSKTAKHIGHSFSMLWKTLMITGKGRMACISFHSPCKLRKSRATDIYPRFPDTLTGVKGWHHPHYDDEHISLCVRHIMVFVPHTLKIVTLRRRDVMCITVRSLGTVLAKGQEAARGSAWAWSPPWVWIARCVWAAPVRAVQERCSPQPTSLIY